MAGKDLSLEMERRLGGPATFAPEVAMNAFRALAAKQHHHLPRWLRDAPAVGAIDNGMDKRRSSAVLNSRAQGRLRRATRLAGAI